MTELPPVLDVCCGPRFMWFDAKDSRALFMDRRRETVKGEWGPCSKNRRDLQINPDVLADFTDIPFLLRRPVATYPKADRPDRYNIVGDRRVDNLEMAKRIASILGLPLIRRFEHNPRSRPGHDLHYGLDGSKLAALGWRPPVDFDASLERTVKWISDNPCW